MAAEPPKKTARGLEEANPPEIDYSKAGSSLTPEVLNTLEQGVFNADVALDAIIFSILAYDQKPELKFKGAELISKDAAQVVVVEVGEVLVIAFRGTELNWRDLLSDWQRNFDKGLTKFASLSGQEFENITPNGRFGRYRGPKVHDGYQEALQYLWDENLKKKIEEFKGKYFFLTGHSQGGGLAALFSAHLLLMEKDKAEKKKVVLYAMAPPRVGNEPFVDHTDELAEDQNAILVRITNLSDPVPLVPQGRYVYGPGNQYNITEKEENGKKTKFIRLLGEDEEDNHGVIILFRHTFSAHDHASGDGWGSYYGGLYQVANATQEKKIES